MFNNQNKNEPLALSNNTIDYVPQSQVQIDAQYTTVKPAVTSALVTKTKKRFGIGKIISLLFMILSLIVIIGGSFLVFNKSWLNNVSKVTGQNTLDILGGLVKGATNNDVQELPQDSNGRTNFLIVGVDAAQELSDTMLIVSYYHKEKQFAALNLPRDLYTSSIYGSGIKLNETHAYAEQNEARSGPKVLSQIIQKEWGLDIHYWIKVNFDAVKDFVDEVGGVDINIPNSFKDDSGFTAFEYGIKSVTFKRGTEHMDGQRALIYARSRKGVNIGNEPNAENEGSDFARSRRQMQVITAILDKMKSDGGKNLFSISKVNSYLNILGTNVATSITVDQIRSFYNTFYNALDQADLSNVPMLNWQNDGTIFCDMSTDRYYLKYCDGQPVGTATSIHRAAAMAEVQNLLNVAKYPELGSASLIVLANQSPILTNVFDELSKTKGGVCASCFSNNYKYATEDGKNVKVYIRDPKIKQQFEQRYTPGVLSFEYTLADLPDNYVLSSANQDVDIVVWID